MKLKKLRYRGAACALSAALLLGSLSGCGGSAATTSSGSASSGNNGELNLYVWTEYVSEEAISDFEKQSGIKVNVSYFSTNEDMLAKVKAESEGAFDIVQPSDYMVEEMINQGLLEQLDQSALTNLSNIGTQYLDQDYDPGNVYSVPYQGGVAAIGINTSMVSDDITSYADLFNDSLKNNLLVLDDYRATIGMVERSMGLSVNETDPDTLSKVSDRLMELKDNIKIYDSDSPKSSLISGECAAAYCWSAEIALAMQENPDIKIVYPTEGAFRFMDNWCVPKGAKNYDNAMKFINYMCSTDAALLNMKEFPYMNANTAAIALDSDYANNEAMNVPAEVYEAAERDSVLDNDTIALYDAMWTKLKQ